MWSADKKKGVVMKRLSLLFCSLLLLSLVPIILRSSDVPPPPPDITEFTEKLETQQTPSKSTEQEVEKDISKLTEEEKKALELKQENTKKILKLHGKNEELMKKILEQRGVAKDFFAQITLAKKDNEMRQALVKMLADLEKANFVDENDAIKNIFIIKESGLDSNNIDIIVALYKAMVYDTQKLIQPKARFESYEGELLGKMVKGLNQTLEKIKEELKTVVDETVFSTKIQSLRNAAVEATKLRKEIEKNNKEVEQIEKEAKKLEKELQKTEKKGGSEPKKPEELSIELLENHGSVVEKNWGDIIDIDQRGSDAKGIRAAIKILKEIRANKKDNTFNTFLEKFVSFQEGEFSVVKALAAYNQQLFEKNIVFTKYRTTPGLKENIEKFKILAIEKAKIDKTLKDFGNAFDALPKDKDVEQGQLLNFLTQVLRFLDQKATTGESTRNSVKLHPENIRSYLTKILAFINEKVVEQKKPEIPKSLEIEEKSVKPPLPQKTYKNGFPEFAIALDSIKKAN